MIKIDKGIPIPEYRWSPKRRNIRAFKYPWHHMEVGDSFLAPDKAGMFSQVAEMNRRSHRKFVCKRVSQKGQVGIRIWRVS